MNFNIYNGGWKELTREHFVARNTYKKNKFISDSTQLQ